MIKDDFQVNLAKRLPSEVAVLSDSILAGSVLGDSVLAGSVLAGGGPNFSTFEFPNSGVLSNSDARPTSNHPASNSLNSKSSNYSALRSSQSLVNTVQFFGLWEKLSETVRKHQGRVESLDRNNLETSYNFLVETFAQKRKLHLREILKADREIFLDCHRFALAIVKSAFSAKTAAVKRLKSVTAEIRALVLVQLGFSTAEEIQRSIFPSQPEKISESLGHKTYYAIDDFFERVAAATAPFAAGILVAGGALLSLRLGKNSADAMKSVGQVCVCAVSLFGLAARAFLTIAATPKFSHPSH